MKLSADAPSRATIEAHFSRWPSLMDSDTAAAYWSISPRKFREMVAEGIITGRKLGPRCVRYSRDDLDAARDSLPHGKGLAPMSA